MGLVLVAAGLSACLSRAVRDRDAMERKWKDAMVDVKSYSDMYSGAEGRNRVFRLTLGQLEHSRDSIFGELEKARKDLGVKDSRLKALGQVSSRFMKADTIVLTDTLFRDVKANVDTLLSDEWYSVKVRMEYPSTVIMRPEFRSVKNIVVSARRETVDPPRKFFLLRWFQKRHTVLCVDVVEKNPYVKNQGGRFVEIVR